VARIKSLCDCVKENEDLFGPKLDFCGSPTTPIVKGSLEVKDMRIFFKNAVTDRSECPGPFAMDDTDLIDTLASALPQIFRHEVLHIFRMEGMQVQHPIDRNLNRIVLSHISLIIIGMEQQSQQRKEDGSIFISSISF